MLFDSVQELFNFLGTTDQEVSAISTLYIALLFTVFLMGLSVRPAYNIIRNLVWYIIGVVIDFLYVLWYGTTSGINWSMQQSGTALVNVGQTLSSTGEKLEDATVKK